MSLDTAWDAMQEEMGGNGGSRVRTMSLVFGYEQQKENSRMWELSVIDQIRAKAADMNERLNFLERNSGSRPPAGTPEFTATWDRERGTITGGYNTAASHEPEQAVEWDRSTGTIRRR